MITIYYAPPSIYGRKVLAVLEEKGLDYEIKRMSFTTKDHESEEYLKINPNGEIPALVDEGIALYESTAIIEYLNDEYVEPPLMPEDSEGRARVRMIEDFCDLHLYRTIVKILMKKLKGEEAPEEMKTLLAREIARIETYLGDKEFIVGNFSLADSAVMAAVISVDGLGFGELLKSKKLEQYIGRLKRHPGWKGAAMVSLEESAASA